MKVWRNEERNTVVLEYKGGQWELEREEAGRMSWMIEVELMDWDICNICKKEKENGENA